MGQDFTQGELETMVRELDAVSTHNANYLYPIKCSVVEKDDVNAYASVEKAKEGETPQAIMVVYSGLVKFCKGDRRIIRAVVAHEISHLMLGHVLHPVFVAKDLRHLWTRQQEMAADAQGAILLEKAGYSKQDMIDMLFRLDQLESEDSWMWKLAKNDHTSARNRAAEVAGNPDVMRSMMEFEKGMAYWECRDYGTATILFDKAYKLEPKLTEALINSAQVSLMHYYDSLPVDVQNHWLLPDFGPMLTNSHVGVRGDAIRDEDRQRFKSARAHIAAAKAKLPNNDRVAELDALATVLDPDATKEDLTKGADEFVAMMTVADARTKLRYANNAALGFHRAEDTQKAYDAILRAQKGTDAFNAYLAENLGRFNVQDRSKEDEALVADVMLTWLKNTAPSNGYYDIVKNRYAQACEKLGVKPEEVKPRPTYLCTVAALHVNGKEAGILVDCPDFIDAFGAPLLRQKIDDTYPDVQFWTWGNGTLSALTERDQIVRVTTEAPDAYVDLKPTDDSIHLSYRVRVGMTTDDFAKILDLSKSTEAKVIGNTGKLETWNFFPNLLLGVHVVNGKITGLTVACTAAEG